ncbi:MAG TPA: protocatechuate 3,4-dioxygenase [Blastocatellia bacterium]|nr:protocatechuate 3,4-dioxygenase [Blastocatellia bacterium]
MSIEKEISRRRFLEMTSALGVLAAVGGLSPAFAQESRLLTAEQGFGPFYPVMKPLDRDADLTRLRGRRASAKGEIIHLLGRAVNAQGRPLPGIKLEIWQANNHGRYAHINDPNTAPLDPNFQGYGVQVTDAKGRFRFKTIKPGAYPTGEGDWSRPPHIHFYVTGRHEALITQMYFPGEELNAKDRLLQSAGASQSSLIARVEPAGKGFEPNSLVATWDIVLTRG